MAWTNPRTWGVEQLLSADLNPHVRDNLNYLKANIGLDASVELTIAAGVVTKTKSYHSIDTQSDDATDDLDTINGGSDGDVIFLLAEDATHTVVLKDGVGAGKLDLRGNDIYLTDINQFVLLQHNGTEWVLVSGPNHVEEFTANAFQYPNPGTDWTPELNGAGLAASLAAKKCWLPLNFLKIGDQIISYKLVGDATETNALTLDCKLVAITKGDPITNPEPAGGGITQVDAGGNFDSEATLTDPEVVATDKQYALEILGTTAASDTITVMGAEIKVIRLS